MSVLNLIRPELLNSENYVPGGDTAQYRLHANESPSSPVSFGSIHVNIYPDYQLQATLEEQLAKQYQVNRNQLLLTRGSDDGIDLLTRLFLTAGKDALMQFPPTFPMYAFYVRLQQASLIQCPLDLEDNFNLTLEKIVNNWRPECKMIMFCRPNNPTGHLIDLNLIAATCERFRDQSVIVVDEAYVEFSGALSAASLIAHYDNLIILRTLSKAYGMANLRVGSIIAQPQIIQALNKVVAPYSISSVNVQLALEGVLNQTITQSSVASLCTSREELYKKLEALSVVEKVYPTATNFILFKTSCAKELTAWLAKQSIAIRDFPPQSLLHDHLRITVGSEEQNRLLLEAITSFINEV